MKGFLYGHIFNRPFYAPDDGGAGGSGKEDKGTKDKSGEGDGNSAGLDDTGGDKGAGKKDILNMTQAELSKKMADEKKQGRMAVLKELGIDTDDVKTNKEAMEKFKEWQNSQKTELELAQENAKKGIAAEERAIKAERKLEAISLGVSIDSVEDLMLIAASKITEEKDFKKVVEEMKADAKYASFFTETSGAGSKGTGSGMKGKRTSINEGGFGARLAGTASKAPETSNYFKGGK